MTQGNRGPAWLKDAVAYEIYPQSFRDSNGDGIGDFRGMEEKLPYIRDLGCNLLWINPCFDSPFRDAGYDVRDYKRVADRYGTNEDLYRLSRSAHEMGIRVLLDLVPGHTSEEHPWFRESRKAEPNEYSGRYVWTDFWIRGCRDYPYIAGEAPRNGAYILNFFKCQPALNYGWLHPTESWQSAMDAPEARATVEAMKDVMRFWLDHGADGFRVDMAASLVKGDDEKKSGTCRIWREIREMLDRDYPEAALVSEWATPPQALNGAGFHMDFYLDHPDNGYHTLMRDDSGNSFFAAEGKGDIRRFLDQYTEWYLSTRGDGYISLLTCNHDTPRPRHLLTPQELRLAYAFLFTLPGVPFLYYGDEIGMRYLDIPTKEGGYTRTGTRTPMQWSREKNLGFSAGEEKALYLPVDPEADAPTVTDQEADPQSLLNTVRALLALRHAHPDLQAEGEFEPLYIPEDGRALVYRRGNLILCVNPADRKAELPEEIRARLAGRKMLFVLGEPAGDALPPRSFSIWE